MFINSANFYIINVTPKQFQRADQNSYNCEGVCNIVHFYGLLLAKSMQYSYYKKQSYKNICNRGLYSDKVLKKLRQR